MHSLYYEGCRVWRLNDVAVIAMDSSNVIRVMYTQSDLRGQGYMRSLLDIVVTDCQETVYAEDFHSPVCDSLLLGSGFYYDAQAGLYVKEV